MQVVLVSTDVGLQQVCRDALSAILRPGWNLAVTEDTDRPLPAADLYIWDFHPDSKLHVKFDHEDWKKHLILVKREHLKDLRERQLPNVNLILKPITPASLSAFLQQVSNPDQEAEANYFEPLPDSLRSDRDDLLQCLIHANLRLQEYDQERTNFLARAIHDFRAPLTALTGYCGLLLGEQLGPLAPEQKEVMQRMHQSAKRLSRMASGMFQLSLRHRVEQQPSLQKHDINESIQQSLYEMQPFMEEKRIAVTVDVEPPQDNLLFERSQIEQVLINLLDNACKFTPRMGSITVRAYPYFWERRVTQSGTRKTDRRAEQLQQPNSFRIDVSDSGPGIPSDQLAWIFEEYTTYKGSQDRSGGGLGLAICKMILTLHNGRVWAESSAGGATFSLVIPYYRAVNRVPNVRGASTSLANAV